MKRAMQLRTQPRQHNMRALLRELGVGDFNATMIIMYMFMSPRQTDPAAAQIILMTKAIQKTLINMGAPLYVTGVLDDDTATALDQIAAPEWLEDTWGNLVEDVVAAKHNGFVFQAAPDLAPIPTPQPTGLAGVLDFLPDVPGGLLTYAAGIGLLYYLHKRKAL